MSQPITCGEALIRLLEAYGVDTVFGIPGVHTLDLYRGLANSPIKHVQARHEQGAGFMADGYARASGKPGVCILISGPGVTNGLTAIGQAFADSIPVLMISSTTASYTLGKGWGCLHEVSNLQAVTAPLTALSATALSPQDLPELLGQAYTIFAARRPRPVHISIPIDVLAQPVEEVWSPRTPPRRPLPNPAVVQAAAERLAQAERPLIFVGGGAIEAAGTLTDLAEVLQATVVSSNAGKGIVPDSHPLSVGGSIWRGPTQQHLAQADVILAIGTELSETDSFIERLEINGSLIRVDIDPGKINDLYPADIGIVADAGVTAEQLLAALKKTGRSMSSRNAAPRAAAVRERVLTEVSPAEQQHLKVITALRQVLPADTVIMGDITQLVYTGSFAMPVEQPRCWHYPAGYCTLGCGLPNAIGAKLALPDRPVIALAGDGGVMFTVQELVTAAELRLPLPVIIWDNSGLAQIRDDMKARNIPPTGVNGQNPDFVALGKAMGCHGTRPDSLAAFEAAVTGALQADRPTVIVVREGTDWLL